MFSPRQPVAVAAHRHSWACLPNGVQFVGRWEALQHALEQLRRLRADAMACANWEAAARLEEHIVLAEERLVQHRQRLGELADRVCGRRSRAHTPAPLDGRQPPCSLTKIRVAA